MLRKLTSVSISLFRLLPKPALLVSILVLGGFFANILFPIRPVESREVFGGGEALEPISAGEPESNDGAIVADSEIGVLDLIEDEGALFEDDALLSNANDPLPGNLGVQRKGYVEYIVESGDTLSEIAGNFQIDVATLLAANPEISASRLSVGASLKIAPSRGVSHTVKSGETIGELAAKYGVSQKIIIDANDLGEVLSVGQNLFIPGGKSLLGAAASRSSSGSYLPTGFSWPVAGPIGPPHGRYDGRDIPAPRGTPIVAAAAGTVSRASLGWNGGYGNVIVIDHGNGVQTLYAHQDSFAVSVGDYVERGQIIGGVGSTGRSTGNHLHFEVRL